MNSPEEKAKEIYKTFFSINQQTDVCFGECNDISICDGTGHGCGRWKLHAKESALICVDEIIATLDKFADYWDLKRGEWYKDELVKIEKVKEEIQKL